MALDPWRVAFFVCCCQLLVPLWVTDLLPLVDLPQHAAQLATGLRWADTTFPYPQYFEINWIANSVAPYAVAHVLGLALPVATALKLVLSVALLAIPLATWRLVRTLRGDRWWVFASFPVAYGYAFLWGFMPFVLAAPIGLLLIDTAIRYRGAPTRSGAFAMMALVYLLFACHVLVLAYAGLVSALIVATCANRRSGIVGSIALASVLPMVAAWWTATTLLTPDSTPVAAPLLLEYGALRVPQLLSFLLGAPDVRPTVLAHALLVASSPFFIGARFTRARWRYAPLLVAVAFHFAIPMNVLGTAYVYPRFTLFVVPALLVALDPAPRRQRLGTIAAVAIAAGSLIGVTARFHAFGVESRDVVALLRGLEPNKRLLALIDDPRSSAVPWFPYLHVGCWYQVERGGISDFSFAEFFPNRFRYRPDMDPPLPYNIEWTPSQFDWSVHGGALYDYFLVRGAGLEPFKSATTRIELVTRQGSWAVYRQTRRVL
jgi:hypothetical protein